jgi:hypothetical protein
LISFQASAGETIGSVRLIDDGTAAFEYGLNRSPPVGPVPLPGALPLFASGLGALGFASWRKRNKAKSAA